MKIERSQLIDDLRNFVLSGNGVIVGKPGIGKTHSILQLTKALKANSVPYLFISVEQLGNATQADVERVLKISTSISAALKEESLAEGQYGIIFFDGFDAIRNSDGRENLIRIIQECAINLSGKWNTIVSVRTYDAAKSERLLKIFPSSQLSSKKKSDSIPCRHYLIPDLTPEEVTGAESSIPGIARLYKAASNDLQSILRIPFYLWLVSRLVKGGQNIQQLSPVASEIELLGSFWNRFVHNTETRDQSESFLTSITRSMVADHSLTLRKESIYNEDKKDVWNALLSAEVLVQTSSSGQRVGFSHNILFDYAVCRLLLEDEPEKLIDFLTQDIARSLFLRPSLTYHFTRLWYDNRDSFWTSFWALLPNSDIKLRLFARLVPTLVLVTEAKNISDLEPLKLALDKKPDVAREAVVRTLQAFDLNKNCNGGPWLDFAQHLSEKIQPDFVWHICNTTNRYFDSATLAADQIEVCGKISRNLMNWLWDERKKKKSAWLDNLGANLIVPLVMKTSSTNVNESVRLLLPILELTNEPNFPIQYFYRLSDELHHFWKSNPDFVTKVYLTVFGHEESSKDVTSMGTPILPLTSNRRQDFDMCQYTLSKEFSEFLATSPLEAVTTGLQCTNAHVLTKEIGQRNRKAKQWDFSFVSKPAVLIEDGSYSWDAPGAVNREEAIKMALAVFTHLSKIASTSEKETSQILSLFADQARVAYLWRRLLKLGSSHPKVFRYHLFDLLLASPLALTFETGYEYGLFLKCAWPHLDKERRIALEGHLLKLRHLIEEEGDEKNKELSRILSQIPRSEIATAELGIIYDGVISKVGIQANVPPVRFSSSWGASDLADDDPSDEVFVEEDFSDDDSPAIAAQVRSKPELKSPSELQIANKAIGRFLSTPYESTQAASDSKEFYNAFVFLKEKLDGLDKNKADNITQSAWTSLGMAAERLSRVEYPLNSDEYRTIKNTVFDLWDYPVDPKFQRTEEEFSTPSWSPTPRNSGIQSILYLTRRDSDERFKTIITSGSSDRDPAIRFLTARLLPNSYKQMPEFFWDTLEARCKAETNVAVLAALAESLTRYIASSPSKGSELTAVLFGRLSSNLQQSDFSELVVEIVVWFAVAKENPWAVSTLSTIINSGKKFQEISSQTTIALLEYADVRAKGFPSHPERFLRAIDWLQKLVGAQATLLTELLPALKSPSPPADLKELLSDYYTPIDKIVARLYFSMDEDKRSRAKNDRDLTDEDRSDFYFSIKPLLETILGFATDPSQGLLFAPTAHHFMELLRCAQKFDPKGTLAMATKVVVSAEISGYTIDQMAIREVVKFTEAILADYRQDLRSSEDIQNLLNLLDAFVKNGWSDALKLVWRLDELFR